MKSFPALRQLTSGYFSKAPLNYETFSHRLAHASKHKPSVTPGILEDFVKAGRKLELEKRNENAYNSNKVAKNDFLGIKHKYSISDIEHKITSFLKSNYDMVVQNDTVIKAYLLTYPSPTNPKIIIDFLTGWFMREGGTDYSTRLHLVHVAIKVLLYDKDYHNAFNLVDCTISSNEWLRRKLNVIIHSNLKYIGFVAVVSLIMALQYLIFIALLWATCGCAMRFGYYRLNYIKQLPRLSWRPHVGILNRIIRNDELFLVNKIITHFEEHSEVNVRNFHHSDVRIVPKLNMLDRNDYILELPAENDANTEIETVFRNQLNKRRMVLTDLQEELMFLDYWLVQGEDYEWCEPDQDPAEIIELETQKRA